MSTLLKKNHGDCELVQKLRERIKWDKRVSEADLDIVVHGGVVIVSGCVDTSFKKNAALQAISDTEGVWAVEDRIAVPVDFHRTDDEITEILMSNLTEMIKIDGEHIELEVINGVVKLYGEVFRPRLKAMAVASAWELSGVKDVDNFIEIIDPPRRAPLTVDEYQSLFPQTGMGFSLEVNTLKEVS
ncbi:MAG: hypothetical protein OM95_07435 [Bdellovibrio sp. ArHS]|uniref:BON domain-containing protein n=1 Tax=Bdellovibrio sp. ArHS TaxID=1569284 RepID=UPI0005835167|nr:BON domain-containing protein [Bdellovibrio sp. ArHS]KHD88633.1 MAG: hypothetical protein OM95_07435 [Bdellovibrio sp. ArHS]